MEKFNQPSHRLDNVDSKLYFLYIVNRQVHFAQVVQAIALSKNAIDLVSSNQPSRAD